MKKLAVSFYLSMSPCPLRHVLFCLLGSLSVVLYSGGSSPLLAIWITSNTTQTGGVFDNTGGYLLEIGVNINDPTLTLAAGATTTNIDAVIVGGLTGYSGEVVVSGGSVLTNDGPSTTIGHYNGTGVIGGYTYLGFESGSTGSAIITGAGSAWNNAGRFQVGESGTGTLLIEMGGSVSSQNSYIGYNAGSVGSATVTGAGSTWVDSRTLAVGWKGTGTLEVSNGGEVSSPSLFATLSNLSGNGVIKANGAVLDETTVYFDSTHGLQQNIAFGTGGQLQLDVDGTGSLGAGHQGTGSLIIQDGVTVASNVGFIGNIAGSEGSVTVTGIGSTWNNTSRLYVGQEGNGTLLIEDTANVSNSDGFVGFHETSNGEATVTGAGSTWANSGELYVGYLGRGIIAAKGTLLVEHGGTVSNTTGNLGFLNGADGKATVTGENSLWKNTGDLNVGYSGIGELIVELGGSVSSARGFIGRNTISTGSVTVTGANSNWNNTGELSVIYNATLNIEEGGSVSNTTGTIGFGGSTPSAVTVTGEGSTWINNGALYVGRYGGGTLKILDQGTVTVSGLTKMFTADTTATIDGGTLTTGSLDRALGTFNHHDGTVQIDGGTYTQAPGALLISGNTALANPSFQLLNGATASNATGVEAVIVGNLADRQGELLISGGSVLTNGGTGSLGTFGAETVQRGETYIGLNTDSAGKVTVSGEGSSLANNERVFVGYGGNGTLLIADGGNVSNMYGILGDASGTLGEATVTGEGSVWNNTGFLAVGQFGDGKLVIEQGGTVTNDLGSIGSHGTSMGEVTVRDPGSTWSSNSLLVGNAGKSGTLTVEAGGTVSNNVGYIGSSVFSTGEVTVTGTDSSWINQFSLLVGNGTLLVEQGGSVTSGVASTESVVYGATINGASTSPGEVTVKDAGSAWIQNGPMTIGSSGNGTLLIEQGGTVSNTFQAFIGAQSSSTGQVMVTGSGSAWNSDGDLVLGGSSLTNETTGTGTLTVASGGKVDVTQKVKVWGNGTIHLQPGGTLSTGDFDFTTGTFDFTGGTLHASGDVTGNVSVPDGGWVKGTGDFTNLAVLDGGTVSPGNSPETMGSAVTSWGAGGNYLWEINSLLSDGGIAGDDPGWDLWNTGTLTVSATSANPFNIEVTSLTVGNTAGALLSWDPSLADSWLIATADIGTFNGSVLSSLLVDATQFSSFNSLDGGSFSLLAANSNSELYLNFTPFSETSTPPVPEPSSLTLATLGLLTLVRSRRQRAYTPGECPIDLRA